MSAYAAGSEFCLTRMSYISDLTFQDSNDALDFVFPAQNPISGESHNSHPIGALVYVSCLLSW